MNIIITAHRWDGGWELHRDGEAITQVTTLDKAADQVRDYLDTVEPDTDHSEWSVEIRAELGALTDEVEAARAATEAATAAAMSAAKQSRDAVRHLRDAGLSVTDSAVILGVSRGRVSQLANA